MAKTNPSKQGSPTSIRFGNLKPSLLQMAFDLDRSLNWLVCKLIKDHPEIKSYLEKNKK